MSYGTSCPYTRRAEYLQDLEKAGYFQPSDTEGETEPEESENSESETE